MAKRLEITAEIAAKLKAATGDPNLDTSKLAVFETVLADTHPLNQRGSLFDKARLSVSMLQAMADVVNKPGVIPLQVLHDRSELPNGKVFSAWLNSLDNGETELAGLFFIPADNAKLVNDIELSVIDSVSIGAKSQKILCSECSFDYLGEEATFLNIFDRSCKEGHVVGENGVHVKCVGLDNWYETSLVGQGAVPRAKIRSRAVAQMPQAQRERLAASGIPAEATVLTATVKATSPSTPKGKTMPNENVTLDGLVSTVASLSADKGTLTAKVTGLEADVAKLTADRDALQTKVTDLEQKLSQAPNGDVVTKLSAAEATLKDVTTFLKDQAKLALTAQGKKADDLPDDPTKLVETIKATGLALHQTFGSGQANPPNAGDGKDQVQASSAFKTRR